jgi:hypothetical protein
VHLLPVISPRGSGAPTLRVLGSGGANGAVGKQTAGAEIGRDVQFREIYEKWFDDVVGWLYALGAPPAETEDLAQEIFIVVRRKLAQFDGGNLAGGCIESRS